MRRGVIASLGVSGLVFAIGLVAWIVLTGEPLDSTATGSTAAGSGSASEAHTTADAIAGATLCGAQVRPEQHRGVCYAHNWQDGGSRGYGTATAAASLTELAGLGMTWISITPFGFQESLTANHVRMVQWGAAENDERLRRVIAQAHDAGLRVMMKPHLWLNWTDWRGDIEPAGADGWERWFASYETFIVHYAALSEDTGADALVVGVELASSAIGHPDRWCALIARVREVYSGPLVYAANWDRVELITFWDALAYIGVQMFAPLATEVDASAESMRASAARYRSHYGAVAKRFERPLILTEVGYKAIVGGVVAPHTWPEHLDESARVYDPEAQAQAYCVILEVFGEADEVAGIYWWKWFTDPETDEEDETGFSPRGKPAEAVLREVYGRVVAADQ